jgi:transaldolase/glucose-6-phosphate isomerase
MRIIPRPGPAAGLVEDALADAGARGLVDAVLAGDPGAWGAHADAARDWTGWMRAPHEMRAHVPAIDDLVSGARRDGIDHLLVLGMGGSSLSPEVTRRTFGHGAGIELRILDSTDPVAVQQATDGLDPARCLAITSSKSGTTAEPLAFLAHVEQFLGDALGPAARDHLVAITDPGTPLGSRAADEGWRMVAANPPDVGGRFSALTLFGLIPMAFAGVPLEPLLDLAQQARDDPQAVRLGVALAALARAGRDKLTIIADPGIGSFGLWAEQLVAESLGKVGEGIVPVADEPIGRPDDYGSDRVVLHLRLTGEHDADVAAIGHAGIPVFVMDIRHPLDVAGLYMGLEMAVAAAGAELGVNPFDQPDVQAAKEAANRALAGAGVPRDERGEPEDITRAVQMLERGDYLALLAFTTPTPEGDRLMAAMRATIRDRTRAATTAGWGPRFLHSTGQLHKGGPGSGVFVQFLGPGSPDLPIPGQDHTFGELLRAQAIGDAQALETAGRRLVRIDLGDDPLMGLRRAAAAVGAVPAP